MKVRLKSMVLLSMVAAGTLFAAGCGQEVKKVENHARPATEKKADDHSGWWCEEHGVPEAICGQCNARVAAELKKKGDWCKTHDRPDSQCFVCHPEKEAEFARQYEAKYGKNPPKPQEEPKKDG